MIASRPIRDYAKLHLIILLWGITAILGKLIDLPSIELVFLRTGLTAIGLWMLLRIRNIPATLDLSSILKLVGIGFLIGIHWILFFLSAKISHVSVCLVALATTAFWTALLEPLLTRGRKFRSYELFLGLIMIAAISWIFQGGFQHVTGFLVGIGSALAGTIFSILNGRYAPKHHHWVITFYEMSGAALFCLLFLPLSATYFTNGAGLDLVPSPLEWVWLLILVFACTIYAYAEYVELLKRLSVFTINLAYNLEPVYGIILAAILFAEHEALGSRFYIGAAVIIATVIAHPFLERASKSPAKCQSG